MESTVTVATVEAKTTKTGKPFKTFVDGEGQSWNVFPFKVKDAYSVIEPGAILKLTWEQSGEYKNIEAIEFQGKTEPPKPVRAATSTDDQAWTNCRTSVMQILDCWRQGKLEEDHKLVQEALRLCMVWMFAISRGGVMPEESPLIESARRAGAVEPTTGNIQQPQGLKRVG